MSRWTLAGLLAGLLIQLCVPGVGQVTEVKGARIGSGELFRLDALDCSGSKTLDRYAGRQFCQEKQIRDQQNYQDDGPAGEYSVIQYYQRKRYRALRCQRKVSVITASCGTFSHSELVKPPDVLKPEKVTQGWCKIHSSNHRFNSEDG